MVDGVKYWKHMVESSDFCNMSHDHEEAKANLSYAEHELQAFLDSYTAVGMPRFEKPSEQK